jgi:hypothetical protein
LRFINADSKKKKKSIDVILGLIKVILSPSIVSETNTRTIPRNYEHEPKGQCAIGNCDLTWDAVTVHGKGVEVLCKYCRVEFEVSRYKFGT